MQTIVITEQFYKTERNCTCAVPCERVVYEPKLSYAQLSHLNVERFVTGSINQLITGRYDEHDQVTTVPQGQQDINGGESLDQQQKLMVHL